MQGRMGCVRETREGRRSTCPRGPRKSFQLAFWECGYFRLVERLLREKNSHARRKNCQSKKTQDRLYTCSTWTDEAVKVFFTPLNGKIEVTVEILEVTSMGLCGCNLIERVESSNSIHKETI